MPAMHNSSKPIKYRLETIDAVRPARKNRLPNRQPYGSAANTAISSTGQAVRR